MPDIEPEVAWALACQTIPATNASATAKSLIVLFIMSLQIMDSGRKPYLRELARLLEGLQFWLIKCDRAQPEPK
jgi:hypothetical protein